MILFYIILMIVFFECIAQYFIRKYHELPLLHYYVLGVMFYAVISYLLHKSYDYSKMGVTQALWAGLSIITIMLLGSFVFGDKIESHEWLGIMIIIVGVLITQMKKLSIGIC
jgi:multidrug transporter EmrE-like cation transporter